MKNRWNRVAVGVGAGWLVSFLARAMDLPPAAALLVAGLAAVATYALITVRVRSAGD